MVALPEMFDMVVTANINGSVLSGLATSLVGGLGLAPSAKVGNDAEIVLRKARGATPAARRLADFFVGTQDLV